MTTWWQEHDEFVRADRHGHDQTLAPHLVRLLYDVEARFVAMGGDAMRWDDPRAVPGHPFDRREALDEEYSRCADPGKYAIVDVRFDAWLAALTAPGISSSSAGGTANGVATGEVIAPFATVTEHEDMLAPGMPVHGGGNDDRPPSRVRTLTPHIDAPTLRLASWVQDPEFLVFEVAVDRPAVRVLLTPYCGCDACDSGSDELLKEVDQWILSIVDGSFEVVERGHDRSDRTSFGGNRRWDQAAKYDPELSVIGRSWWPGRRSRPLVPPF